MKKMMYFLLTICCISCASIIILSCSLAKNKKEMTEMKKNNKQINEKQLFYQREITRLKQQIKIFEEKETEELKEQPTKVWDNKTLTYSNIFEGKKAIIGNYDSFSAEMTRQILRNFGLSVEIVKTGVDLYDKVANGCKYDIIFTNNIYQQGFDGQALLRKLKELDGFDTPVVVHTISKGQRIFFIDKIGFDEYLEKPIQTDEIEKVLHKFLKPNKKS